MDDSPPLRKLATIGGAALVGVFALAFLLQLPLALAPGYYSHDELQWAWRAGTVDLLPWWDDRTTFQFRPLTFNLWLVLSRAFFDIPWAFHSVVVAWGSLHAALLCAVGRRFGMAWGPAVLGALAFVLTPYAMFTHGWVATLADLIWVSCALVLAWCVLRFERPVLLGVLAFALALEGMSAKEAAVAIPLLCAVAWAFDPARRARWLAALVGAGGAVALFLAWRMPALLHAPRDGGDWYVPSLAHVPARWLEYQAFLPMLTAMEVHTTWHEGLVKCIIVALLWVALVIALWTTRRRLAVLFLTGGLAALAPVLLLGRSANHYAYAFAAVAAMCVAAAWPHATRRARIAIATFAVLTSLHGIAVMLEMHYVAKVQSVFSPALARVLIAQPSGTVVLRPAPDAKPWIFQRLTHQIPAYDGVRIGDRAVLAPRGQPADYEIAADGSLRPLAR